MRRQARAITRPDRNPRVPVNLNPTLPPRSANAATRAPNKWLQPLHMHQSSGVIEVVTERQGLTEITAQVVAWVRGQNMDEGLLTLFCRHTSASLLIQENAAREVRTDLEDFFA